jgi:small redox-active disulfide protein 2
MVSVKILGTGCKRCHALEEKVREVAKQNNIDAEFEKVTEIADIMKYGIMMTPGLVVNEKVKSYGKIPDDNEIITWLKEG